MRRVRVAVVDDSAFVRLALERIFSSEPRIEVCGIAASGEELLAHVESWRPDVVTLDLAMPGLGGLATLDRLQLERPTPVLVLSSHAGGGAARTIEALYRGAVDLVDKEQYSLVDFEALSEVLIEKVLELAAVPAAGPAPQPRRLRPPPIRPAPGRYELVAIGASTGGPMAIERLLSAVDGRLAVPVVVAQHMPVGFTAAFAQRLDSRLGLPVAEAADGAPLDPGTVTIAPAGRHLVVHRGATGLVARLEEGDDAAPHRPSIDLLFSSAATQLGPRVVGVLLTGMGEDGAGGMERLAAAGALTLAQDRATSVVYGMPRAAAERGAAREILPLQAIAERLRALAAGPAPAAAARRLGTTKDAPT